MVLVDTSVFTEVAFSPNSELLYVVVDSAVYQFNIESSPIFNSKTIVAKFDGFVDRVPTYFATPVLAPNGKYI